MSCRAALPTWVALPWPQMSGTKQLRAQHLQKALAKKSRNSERNSELKLRNCLGQPCQLTNHPAPLLLMPSSLLHRNVQQDTWMPPQSVTLYGTITHAPDDDNAYSARRADGPHVRHQCKFPVLKHSFQNSKVLFCEACE